MRPGGPGALYFRAATMNPEPRAHTSIGRRGLEVTIATPWAMTGVICALSVLGMMAAFAILVATVEITGSEPDGLAILDILFGRAWLWAGVAVLVLLIVSDRFSNDYGSANHHQRHGALHQEVVVPAYCTQRPRLGTGFFLYQPFIDLHFPCGEIDRATGS